MKQVGIRESSIVKAILLLDKGKKIDENIRIEYFQTESSGRFIWILLHICLICVFQVLNA